MVVGVLKRLKKIKALTVEEPSTKVKPINKDKVIVETGNEDTNIDDLTFHVSP